VFYESYFSIENRLRLTAAASHAFWSERQVQLFNYSRIACVAFKVVQQWVAFNLINSGVARPVGLIQTSDCLVCLSPKPIDLGDLNKLSTRPSPFPAVQRE